MFKKKIFIILLFFLTQCGYNSVYKNSSNQNLKIVLNNFTGDKEFNKKINSEIKKYYNNNSENIFEISVDSNLKKQIISKNTKGEISMYELIVRCEFEIKHKNKSQLVSFNESLKIKTSDDSFEQKKYENIVKNNFAKSIKDKLILKLNTLE